MTSELHAQKSVGRDDLRQLGRPACLWLNRIMPFPLDTGDRIYSTGLIRSLAAAGAAVTSVGLASAAQPTDDAHVAWLTFPGRPRGTAASLLSFMPRVAKSFDLSAYRAFLRELLQRKWDAVIIDHYAMGVVLPDLNARSQQTGARPVCIHVSHDHEETVTQELAEGYQGSRLRKFGLYQNFMKTRRFERMIAADVDIVGCITQADAEAFRTKSGAGRAIVLSPGYDGRSCATRVIGPDMPRRVLIMGSFGWVAKQENLRQFLRHADPAFHAAGITLDVVGMMPDLLRAELTPGLRATTLHGFVDNPADLADQARIAAVPEQIGGGFKLKFLDFVFQRIPVAAITACADVLPYDLGKYMLTDDSLAGLVLGIVAAIDDFPRLNALQDAAYTLAHDGFSWLNTGRTLLGAIQSHQGQTGGHA